MAHRSVVTVVTLASSFALAGALLLTACADDEVIPGPKPAGLTPVVDSGGGGGGDSAPMPTVEAGTEAGGDPTINDCSVYVDRTDAAASRNIQWDIFVNSLPEHCMKIKAGQTVTLVNGAAVADFSAHPVGTNKEPEKSPGPAVDEATGKLVFAAASPFQVNCQIHPQMKVVILVVP